MLISNNFGARIAILFFLINVSTSKLASVSQCHWKEDVDCWLLCTGGHFSNVTFSAEEKWTERPQCHAEGIALGLFGIFYMNFTVTANWFQAKVKVNDLDFGTGWVNEIEDNAFNADAFKSVKHLTITTMDLYEMKKGLFNGLESLEKLNLMDTSLVRSVDMGILDGLNQTLKELTIDGNKYIQTSYGGKNTHGVLECVAVHALNIESFTGSQQTLPFLEYIKVRYYLQRLISKSFLSLTNIKHLDVSYCCIEYIEEGAFDPVIGSIIELLLIGNKIKKFPGVMLDLVPLSIMGTPSTGCQCNKLRINFTVELDCELGKFCSSFLPTALITTTTITTNTPTTVLTSSTNEETSYPPTQHDTTTSEVINPSTGSTSSTSEESSVPPIQTDSTTSEVIYPSTVPTSSSTLTILKAEIQEFKSGDVILHVYVSKLHSKIFLDFSDEETRIGYIREINCPISTSNSRCSVTVTNLKESSNYTFCVIDNLDEANERLCIHYTTRGPSYLQLWFVKISSTMIVVMAATMCILLVLICFIAFLSKN